MQRSGDRVRITAQIIDGHSDKHLWANSYERDVRDVFGLRSEVASDIASQFQTRLTTPNQARAPREPVNRTALEAYLEGTFLLQSGGRGRRDQKLRTAAQYFQQAIDASPDFVKAYIGLAQSHDGLMWPASDDIALMKQAAEKAAALDPASSEARTELAIAKLEDWDWSGAEQEFRRAIALNPNDALAHAHLAGCYCEMGRLEECWKQWETAQQLDPNEDDLSQEFLWRGDYDRAVELGKRLVENHPNDATNHWFLAEGYALKGMHKDWVRETSEWITLVGFPDSASRIRQAFRGSGYQGALRQVATEMEQWVANKEAYVPGNLATVYASLGDKDRAFYWLGHGIDHHSMALGDSLGFFRVDPAFAPLWSDPRFKDMLRRAGLPQ